MDDHFLPVPQPKKTLPHSQDDERKPEFDRALRPANWDEYVGQDKIKQNIRIIIDAAKKRGESIDHLLFHGQAGLGKTSLAYLVSKEMGANLKVTSGPTLEKMGDLAAILSSMEANDILFIDEAHRLNHLIEEVLYPAMENFKLHLIIGKGVGARTLTLDIPPFTLIAATTRADLLSAPLRSRFGASFKLDYYGREDIQEIIKRSATLLGVGVTPEALALLASASRLTPRIANRLLRRARDYAEIHGKGAIDESAVEKTLELLEIDGAGLELTDRRLLETIIRKFNGGPVGIGTLAAALTEEKSVIEEIYEPYLMSIGFLRRTPSGRMATDAAYAHFGTKRGEKGGLV